MGVAAAPAVGDESGGSEGGSIGFGGAWRAVINAAVGHQYELIIPARAFYFRAVIERLAHLLGSCELRARPGIRFVGISWRANEDDQKNGTKNRSRTARPPAARAREGPTKGNECPHERTPAEPFSTRSQVFNFPARNHLAILRPINRYC